MHENQDNPEKHIADVELPGNLVIELQHSPMPLEEMRSREAFYKRMVWIVDSAPFRKNIWIFDPLPDPSLPIVDDLVFYPPQPEWRDSTIVRDKGYNALMFYRRSTRDPDSTLVRVESGRSLDVDFRTTYIGHRLFLWIRPRDVWYQTTHPTYLDLGNGFLGRLMRYKSGVDDPWCLHLVSKEAFIQHLLRTV